MIQTLILLWVVGSGLSFIGENSPYKRLTNDDLTPEGAAFSIFFGQGILTVLAYGLGYLVTSAIVFWINYF